MARTRGARDGGWSSRGQDRHGSAWHARRARDGRGGARAANRWRAAIVALALVIVYNQMQPPAQVEAPVADFDPVGRTVAWRAAEDWLASGVLGADGRVVSWNGSERMTLSDGGKTRKGSVNRLVCSTDSGWWTVSVGVYDDGTLASHPSAATLGDAPDQSVGTAADWPDALGQLAVSDSLDTLVTQWARALMGSDSDVLRALMADPSGRAYQSLHLGDVASAGIDKASYLPLGRQDRNEGTSDRAGIRVTVTLKDADGATSGQISYDLLVADPDGAPRILAWGAPGTVLGLEEYSNALPDGVKADDREDGDDAAAAADKTADTGAADGDA